VTGVGWSVHACKLCLAEMCSYPSVQKSAGGASSNGNGGGEKVENADGSVTHQDPLDMYCEDNPETDECRSASYFVMCFFGVFISVDIEPSSTCHQTKPVAKGMEHNSMLAFQ